MCYERSIDLCRELADRYNEAATLVTSATFTTARATTTPPAGHGHMPCAYSTRSTIPRATGRAKLRPRGDRLRSGRPGQQLDHHANGHRAARSVRAS